MKEKAYHEKVNVKNEVKLRRLLDELPAFCRQFFIGIEATTGWRTPMISAAFLSISRLSIPSAKRCRCARFPFPF